MFLILISSLLSLSYSANILVTVGTYGSHLYVSAAVADVLVDAGHNVTVLSLFGDANVDMSSRQFYWSSVHNKEESMKELESINELIDQLVGMPSKDMMRDMLAGTDLAKKRSTEFFLLGYNYFTGENFASLMHEGNFDLVVMEDTAVAAAYYLIDSGLPVIGLTCTSDIAFHRSKEAYPPLQFSEPNSLLGADFPPTLKQRWDATIRMFGIMKLFGSMFFEHPELTKVPLPELERVTDVKFVMDHPAVGFPYLLPSNIFSLGFFNLRVHRLSPLPDDLSKFITNCPHDNIVYMSFGSFFRNINKFQHFETMLKVLAGTDACLILKFSDAIEGQFGFANNQVFTQSWIPQKDLLGSGKVSFFVSHCGNNGRLESIFYNVPLLCVPLFAEQLHNAAIVERNKFGIMMMKEAISVHSFKLAVDAMFENWEIFASNMKDASDAVIDDPGSGLEVLKYHVNRLLKFGKTNYLRNSIIKQQSIIEVYNLDILMLFFVTFLGSIVGFLVCGWKCIRCVCKKLTKYKQD